MNFSINTNSGGLIEVGAINHRFNGQQLILHVDQTANINNGEGDASIIMTANEIKELIALLNSFLFQLEGKVHVILAEPLIDPAVKIQVDFMEYIKNHPDIENNDSGISDK